MRSLCMVACLVAVVFTTGVDVMARNNVVNALKQQSASLLSRWQQRVSASPQVKTLLQIGVGVVICTTMACGGVTQAPEVAESNSPAVSETPDVAKDAAGPETPDVVQDDVEVIRTDLFGSGFIASRGLIHTSIKSYQKYKDKLPIQFYDGMMVHQIENGQDFIHIVDLIDNKALKVRYIGPETHKIVALETINGVMVGTHPDYGGRYTSFAAEFARSVNGRNGAELLTVLPEGTTLYGEPNVIFSDGDYAMTVHGFSFVDGPIQPFPAEVRFIVAAEHLVTIARPASLPPQEKTRPRPYKKRRNNKQNMQIATYRVDDADVGLAVPLLVSDSGVFPSK